MNQSTDDARQAAADLAFRRKALRVNGAIYARRHGPCLLPVLAGDPAIRARYIGQIGWLESEQSWRPQNARAVSELAGAIARLGRLRPDLAETCDWHAARLRELARQHEAIARLEAVHRPVLAWPSSRSRTVAGARLRRRAQGG